MTTTITIAGTEVSYRDFEITVPTSPVDVAPSAEITTNATESVAANDTLQIDIDGTTVFEGRTRSGGTISELGGVEVTAAHQARDVFEDTVSLSLVSPTTEEVLSAALSAATGGSALTLSYSGTAASLNNDYDCTDRSVKRVFRDMMDRTGRVWWVDPAGTTVHVQPLGARGTWQAIDTQADRATLQRFDTGNVDTVRNAVTVVGTGEEQVRATAEDATSISEYGRRTGNSPYNVSYVTAQSEAAAVASELLITDPQPEGTLLVGSNVGDVTQALANYQVDVTDQGKNLDIDNLVVEQQTIEQGRATLTLGAGTGVSIEEINRRAKSQDDQNEPGSVYNTDRLADQSVDTDQLVDTAVIEQKLEDAAVATAKLENNAVINGKLDDLSVSETKIQDNSISTPKLVAEAVTANEIESDTITAAQIAAGTITALEVATDTLTASEIAADTITALEIAADSITTNELAALAVDTETLEITNGSGDGVEFNESGGTVVLEPTANGSGGIGSASNRYGASFFDSLNMDIANIGTIGAQGSQIAEGFETGDATTADIYLRPTSDNTNYLGTAARAYSDIFTYDLAVDTAVPQNGNDTGNVGVSGNYFNGMRANAFFEESPEPVQDGDVDLDELAASEWYDLPEYVRRETARKQVEAEGTDGDAETDGGLPDPDGVELGTMLNYVFEVAKAQQNRIDDLEKRIERLENGQGG